MPEILRHSHSTWTVRCLGPCICHPRKAEPSYITRHANRCLEYSLPSSSSKFIGVAAPHPSANLLDDTEETKEVHDVQEVTHTHIRSMTMSKRTIISHLDHTAGIFLTPRRIPGSRR